MFSEKFILLQQESMLTKSSLCNGLTCLRKANLGDQHKGLFYTAFFQLSIGIERFLKIIVMLDFMASNDLKVITDKELKNNYGHKIKDLYAAAKAIADKRGVKNCIFYSEGTEYSILHFLHEFALSTRYYNLSQLSGNAKGTNPLAEWWNIILFIYWDEITEKKRHRIQSEALAFCDANMSNSFTMFHSMNGDIMTEVDLILHPQIIEAGSPHSVWLVIKILQPLFRVLIECQHQVHLMEQQKGFNTPDVPYMSELFPFIYTDRQSALRRKQWN